MRVGAFRIQNFRSIVDSGWRNLSTDNITALVGQNESGKSSILEAIYAFESGNISVDDVRANQSLPVISISYLDVSGILNDINSEVASVLLNPEFNPHQRLNVTRSWVEKEGKYIGTLAFEEKKFAEVFSTLPKLKSTEDLDSPVVVEELSVEDFLDNFWKLAPAISLFSDRTSILPSRINLKDIEDKNSKANGKYAVTNFMEISGLSVAKLKDSSRRNVVQHLKVANESITREFQEFWDQQIGGSRKIQFVCELEHHSPESGGSVGEPYLEFGLTHDGELLYPHQRSRGVVWFLSFFLQLRARAREERDLLILIDEPGSNLHAKAQKNVLEVFEDLKGKMQIIYSTHSPYLVDPDKLFRILAVQRGENTSHSDTEITTAHDLGSANIDTLTPVYTAMGLGLHQSPVIPKDKNIVLEEISCFYYIKAFYLMTNRECLLHFLPAQGVSKIPTLANLLLGWGIKFAIFLDDDTAGREVFNSLKRHFFMDDDSIIATRMMKSPVGRGIENVFSRSDFISHIVGTSEFDASKSENCEGVRNAAKGMIAARFYSSVCSGDLNKTNFSQETLDSIDRLINMIENMDS